MMRRFVSSALPALVVTYRNVTSYDCKPLTHKELTRLYPSLATVGDAHAFAESQLLPALEAVEKRVAMWRLNRWELRIPALLSGLEKENAQQQLHHIRKHMTDQCEILDKVAEDKTVLMQCLNIREAEELSGRSRSWLQSRVDALRWEGKVADAKAAREAWVRLEQYGNRDYRLLERVCAVYSMARLNTFADAFSNFIVEDSGTKKLTLEKENPFQKALEVILTSMPTIDVCYEFLGLSGSGYTNAMKRYIRYCLVASRQSGEEARVTSLNPLSSRILYSSPTEVLFDLTQVNPSAEDSDEASHGVGDLIYVSSGTVTLISAASPNRHVRSLQVPSRRQLEGIARRLCLVMDIPMGDVKVQFLYLPPTAMDADSLSRLHRAIGLVEPLDALSEKGHIPEWASLYNGALAASDIDYVEIRKKFPEEEWVML